MDSIFDEPTTALSIYSPYLKSFNTFGIFPFKIEHENKKQGEKNVRKGIWVSCQSGFHLWKHQILFFFYLLHQGFLITQIIRHFFYQHFNQADLATLFGWALHGSMSAVTSLLFFLKREKLFKFLMEWDATEYDVLYGKWDNLDLGALFEKRRKVQKSFHAQKYIYKMSVAFYTAAGTALLSLVYVCFRIYPNLPAFLASLIHPSIDGSLLRNGLISFQLLQLLVLGWSLAQFEIISLAFGQSVSRALKIIGRSTTKQLTRTNSVSIVNFEKEDRSRNGLILDNCLEKYEKLRDLTNSYNDIFAWYFFLYKAFVMSQICVSVFVAWRRVVRFTGSIWVFVGAIVFFFCRISFIIPTLGSVYRETDLFKKAWIRAIPDLTISSDEQKKMKRRMKSCSPFGIRSGSFYLVEPKSLLIFYSIMTTYITVLFQL